MASKRRRSAAGPARRRRTKRLWWEDLTNEELLDVRLCDLDLSLEGTALENRIERLHEELSRAGLCFRPHVWLSSDWFAPDGVVGFALPFFLAHKRLMRLEHRYMFEVEGGTSAWCMKLLRHETGHALDNAYRLHWKKKWRETFGRFSEPYHGVYAANPGSRRHVQHLGYWYSQSHPAEDFAESFAVWLTPGKRWRTSYKGWPVMKKLEFIDELMQDIGEKRPAVTSRARPDSLRTQKVTLGEYYEEKQSAYADPRPDATDLHLYRVFTDDPAYIRRETAGSFLRRFRTELRNRVAHITSQPKYSVDQVLDALILRCRELGLRVPRATRELRVDATILVTIMTMRFVHGRKPLYRR